MFVYLFASSFGFQFPPSFLVLYVSKLKLQLPPTDTLQLLLLLIMNLNFISVTTIVTESPTVSYLSWEPFFPPFLCQYL